MTHLLQQINCKEKRRWGDIYRLKNIKKIYQQFARDATYLDMSFFPKALKIFEAIKALNTDQIFDDTKEI